jgi:cellulose synthase/poly-beta-1,6-N-acetylglucosamine synthase-like glycosyltransferase
MNNTQTLIFVPTYNERENVERLCLELLDLDIEADILFLDDNSPDGTGRIVDRLATEHENVSNKDAETLVCEIGGVRDILLEKA